MQLAISEIDITPVKPNGGLVAFVSFVVNDALYCGSIAIMTRPAGGFRLAYPTKHATSRELNIFHPINNEAGRMIEEAVITKFEEVMNYGRYRHSDLNHQGTPVRHS